jgi:hypothetical protein
MGQLYHILNSGLSVAALHCLWVLKGYYTSHLLILTWLLALLRITAAVETGQRIE